MKLIKAPDDFLEKKVNDFDFNQMDAEKISSEMFDITKVTVSLVCFDISRSPYQANYNRISD